MSSTCTIHGGCPKRISTRLVIVSNLLYNCSDVGLLGRCIRKVNQSRYMPGVAQRVRGS